MSRIIVKQLPKNITEEKIRNLFGSKGTLTDVQLKYTPDGKFRQFCFIGYRSKEDAQQAIDFFNNTCIQTSRVKVELCSTLGDEDKPRAWSKYTKEKQIPPKEETANNNEKQKKEKVSKFEEIIGKHKDDPEFQEFLKVHDKNRVLWSNDAEIKKADATATEKAESAVKSLDKDEDEDDGSDSEAEEEAENEDASKLAEKPISDLEYMKSLMSNIKVDKKSADTKKSNTIDLFTIKMHNVPYKLKRQEILKFFKPLKPYSVRLPTKVHGFCYVGFKTEKDMSKAMLKDKSFIKGKQVFFSDFTEKNKVTKAKLNGIEVAAKDSKDDKNPKWTKQEENIRNEEDISESGKIFFRNLAYTVTDDDLQKLFDEFGPVAEINLPVDLVTRQIKGFGTVTFVMPEHAVRAFNKLDGSIFHGRLLHLIPGKSNEKENEINEDDANLTFKQKKAMQLKKTAGNVATWNSLFLGPNAIAEILAKKFETTKEKILDTKQGGSSAAVRIALGETQIVIEMKKFLEEHGVHLHAFDSATVKRSKSIIIAKNLPPETKVEDLTPLFAKFGPIGRIVLPPSGVTALIEFCDSSEARQAFKKLAYSKFKNLPLYLEWAPENAFKTNLSGEPMVEKQELEAEKKQETDADHDKQIDEDIGEAVEEPLAKVEEQKPDDADDEPEMGTTLFLRNLNFKTVQSTVYNHFKHLGTIHTVEIAKKRDPNNPGQFTSLGYGFIQFKRQQTLEQALKEMQMTFIDGNQVELKRSDRILKSNNKSARKDTKASKQTGSKILVRNIPFQAKEREVRELFQAFGDIRNLRLPLKLTPGEHTHRGFGFVDFSSKSDAKRAFEALSQSTHLYGRRLVLEWASNEEEDIAELRKRTAQQFPGSTAKFSKKGLFDVDTDAAKNGMPSDDDEADEKDHDADDDSGRRYM